MRKAGSGSPAWLPRVRPLRFLCPPWFVRVNGRFTLRRTTPQANCWTRRAPFDCEIAPGQTSQVAVETIYLDGTSEGAFIIASTRTEPTQVRITLSRQLRQDGVAFGGSIALREMVPTGSVNGEQVLDALPA